MQIIKYLGQLDFGDLYVYYFIYTLYAGAMMYVLRWEKIGAAIMFSAYCLPFLILIPVYPGLILGAFIGVLFKPDVEPSQLFGLSISVTVILFYLYRRINPPNETILEWLRIISNDITIKYKEYDLEYLIANKTLEDSATFLFLRLESGREHKFIRGLAFFILFALGYFSFDWDLAIINNYPVLASIPVLGSALYFYMRYYNKVEKAIYAKFIAVVILLAERNQTAAVTRRGEFKIVKNNIVLPKSDSKFYQFVLLEPDEHAYELNRFVDYGHFKEALSNIQQKGVQGYCAYVAQRMSGAENSQ